MIIYILIYVGYFILGVFNPWKTFNILPKKDEGTWLVAQYIFFLGISCVQFPTPMFEVSLHPAITDLGCLTSSSLTCHMYILGKPLSDKNCMYKKIGIKLFSKSLLFTKETKRHFFGCIIQIIHYFFKFSFQFTYQPPLTSLPISCPQSLSLPIHYPLLWGVKVFFQE